MEKPVVGQTSPTKLNFWQYLVLEWFRPIGEALLVAFLITTFLFTTVGVFGQSDEPNLHQGERLVIPKYQTWLHRFGIGSFQRGELVVVRPNATSPYAVQPMPFLGQFGATFHPFFIKRIVGLPGDRLRLDKGQLYINGVAVDESHTVAYWRKMGQLDETSDRANSESWPFRRDETAPIQAEYVVPAGTYFVMGDNRSYGGSEDSRGFGPVPLRQIGGKATFVLWPPFSKDANGKMHLNLETQKIPDGFKAIK